MICVTMVPLRLWPFQWLQGRKTLMQRLYSCCMGPTELRLSGPGNLEWHSHGGGRWPQRSSGHVASHGQPWWWAWFSVQRRWALQCLRSGYGCAHDVSNLICKITNSIVICTVIYNSFSSQYLSSCSDWLQGRFLPYHSGSSKLKQPNFWSLKWNQQNQCSASYASL